MLHIGMEFRKGLLFIRFEGILNQSTKEKFNDCLDQMIYEKGVKYFVFNLEGMTFLDEEGIQILENRYYDVILHDGEIILCGCHHILTSNLVQHNFFLQVNHSNTELGAFQLINI